MRLHSHMNDTWHSNICLVTFYCVCCLCCLPLLCLSSPPAVYLPASLLCLCDMFVRQPHMVMIETLSLVQMAHLSHTCLPAAAVARARGAAGESISCWLPHWVAPVFVKGTVTPDPATTSYLLHINVTLDSLKACTAPLLFHHTQACMITRREKYGKINTCNIRSWLKWVFKGNIHRDSVMRMYAGWMTSL